MCSLITEPRTGAAVKQNPRYRLLRNSSGKERHLSRCVPPGLRHSEAAGGETRAARPCASRRYAKQDHATKGQSISPAGGISPPLPAPHASRLPPGQSKLTLITPRSALCAAMHVKHKAQKYYCCSRFKSKSFKIQLK